MLKGIDISNWQAGLDPHKLGIDFCICKATEGTNFVDGFCDGFIQDCKNNGILWGFYHFAREYAPEREAQFFYDNCTGYVKHGIPVLDYEVWGQNDDDDVAWCEKFLTKFHDLSGVWPMLYISASHCGDFHKSWIPQKCGLWVAGYPTYTETYPLTDEYGVPIGGESTRQAQYGKYSQTIEMPYDIAPWEFAAIWQFTSSLKLKGYNGSLDGDLAYMDKAAWGKYAGAAVSSKQAATKPTTDTGKKVLTGRVTIELD